MAEFQRYDLFSRFLFTSTAAISLRAGTRAEAFGFCHPAMQVLGYSGKGVGVSVLGLGCSEVRVRVLGFGLGCSG